MKRLSLALLLIAGIACQAIAQSPSSQKQLRIVVGYPAGGGLDAATRFLADQLRETTGQSIIVENRPGAASLLAAEAVSRERPDGSVILVAPITVPAVHPFVFKKLNFDPLNDLVPVAEMGTFRYALAVNPNIPAKTVPSFIEWAKANRGHVSFATLGAGSFAQIIGLVFNQAADTGMTEVPYKGSAPGLVDLRAGHVQATFDTNSSLFEHHKAGAIRILAVSGSQRSPILPDVPTFGETKVKLGELDGAEFWYGVFAPKGTPKATVTALNEMINTALKSPKLVKRLEPLDITPRPRSSDEFAAQVKADNQLWGKVIQANPGKFTVN
jgi:tripartite-type tricarboxylate transporter receptor subunit TctC